MSLGSTSHEPPPIEEDAAYWRQKYEEALHAADPPQILEGVERLLLDDGREFVLWPPREAPG